MDTFPGMQFEPGSLHQYLYCENRPVDRWDPSGMFLGVLKLSIVTIMVATIFTSIAYVAYGNFLNKAHTPVKWSGTFILCVYRLNLGIGTGYIELTSEPHFGEQANGKYWFISAGLTRSVFIKNTTICFVDLESPGLFGPNPKLLSGPFSFSSLTAAYIIGIGALGFFMGIGKGHAIWKPNELENIENWTFGRDIGFDIMGGWSFLLNPK